MAARHRPLVALGGAVGTLARVGVDTVLPDGGLPLSVVLVDLTGAMLLGMLHARSDDPRLRALLGTGLLGSWTTFSGLAVAQERLLVDDPLVGLVAGVATVAAGLGAAVVGRRAGARS